MALSNLSSEQSRGLLFGNFPEMYLQWADAKRAQKRCIWVLCPGQKHAQCIELDDQGAAFVAEMNALLSSLGTGMELTDVLLESLDFLFVLAPHFTPPLWKIDTAGDLCKRTVLGIYPLSPMQGRKDIMRLLKAAISPSNWALLCLPTFLGLEDTVTTRTIIITRLFRGEDFVEIVLSGAADRVFGDSEFILCESEGTIRIKSYLTIPRPFSFQCREAYKSMCAIFSLISKVARKYDFFSRKVGLALRLLLSKAKNMQLRSTHRPDFPADVAIVRRVLDPHRPMSSVLTEAEIDGFALFTALTHPPHWLIARYTTWASSCSRFPLDPPPSNSDFKGAYLFIAFLFMGPTARGSGLASRLVANLCRPIECCDLAQQFGVLIEGTVIQQEIGAINFWKQMGAKITQHWDRDESDVFIFSLQLPPGISWDSYNVSRAAMADERLSLQFSQQGVGPASIPTAIVHIPTELERSVKVFFGLDPRKLRPRDLVYPANTFFPLAVSPIMSADTMWTDMIGAFRSFRRTVEGDVFFTWLGNRWVTSSVCQLQANTALLAMPSNAVTYHIAVNYTGYANGDLHVTVNPFKSRRASISSSNVQCPITYFCNIPVPAFHSSLLIRERRRHDTAVRTVNLAFFVTTAIARKFELLGVPTVELGAATAKASDVDGIDDGLANMRF